MSAPLGIPKFIQPHFEVYGLTFPDFAKETIHMNHRAGINISRVQVEMAFRTVLSTCFSAEEPLVTKLLSQVSLSKIDWISG